MDLRDWLRSLGLERYEAAFRENEIDETVLPSLTAEDLKDLGVSNRILKPKDCAEHLESSSTGTIRGSRYSHLFCKCNFVSLKV